MKKTYSIPVIYEMMGRYMIEAESLEEAVKIAIEDSPLPEDGEYISDSMFVDKEGIEMDNEEMNQADIKYLKSLEEPVKFG